MDGNFTMNTKSISPKTIIRQHRRQVEQMHVNKELSTEVGLEPFIFLLLISKLCQYNEKQGYQDYYQNQQWWVHLDFEELYNQHSYLGTQKTQRKIIRKLENHGYLTTLILGKTKLYRVNDTKINIEELNTPSWATTD
jgi:hypothetical protein